MPFPHIISRSCGRERRFRFNQEYQQGRNPGPKGSKMNILKALAKAGLIAAVLYMPLFGLAALLQGAEITGPESVETGTLAVFTAETEGAWAIFPETPIAADSAGNRCFFASNKEQEFTLVFCHIADSKPIISTFTFFNGSRPEPIPEPEPEPKPTDPLEASVQKWTIELAGPLFEKEKGAMIATLDSVLAGFDAGTLRTVPGSRAAFRKIWNEKATAISAESVQRWSGFISEVSTLFNHSAPKSLEADFRRFRALLKGEINE